MPNGNGAQTYVGPGWHATIVAPASLQPGEFVAIGSILASTVQEIPSGQSGGASIVGTHQAPKVSGDSWAAGEKLGWDVSENAVRRTFTPVAGDLQNACVAAVAAAAGATTCVVLLTPGSSTLVT